MERDIDKLDSLLQEANLRYPIGTKYISLDAQGELRGNTEYSKRKCALVFEDPHGSIGIDCGQGYVYVKGKWADIVQSVGEISPGNVYSIY